MTDLVFRARIKSTITKAVLVIVGIAGISKLAGAFSMPNSTASSTYNQVTPKIQGQSYYSTEYNNGNATGTATIDWSKGNVQYVTLTGNTTFTFINPQAGIRMVLNIKATGAYSPTLPSTVRWAGGTTPTWTATNGYADLVAFAYSGVEGLYKAIATTNFAAT